MIPQIAEMSASNLKTRYHAVTNYLHSGKLKLLLNSPSPSHLPKSLNARQLTSYRPAILSLSWKRIDSPPCLANTSRGHPLHIKPCTNSRYLVSFQYIPKRHRTTRQFSSTQDAHLLEVEKKAKMNPADASVQYKYLKLVSRVDLEHAIRWYEQRRLRQLSDARLNVFYSEMLRERDPGNFRRDGLQSSGFDYVGSPQPHEQSMSQQFSDRGQDYLKKWQEAIFGEKGPGIGQDGRQSSGLNYAQAQQPLLAQNGMGTKDRPLQIVMEEEKKAEGRKFWDVVRLMIAGYIVYNIVSNFSPGQMISGSKQYIPEKSSQTVRFDDVQGCDEAKAELQEVVQFLKDPEKFEKLGAKIPCGVLLVGPPGTGKTLLARAIAGEANVPFYFASGSEFDEMFVGVGASRIRKLFQAAKENAPSIIFIDELDAVGGRRSVDEQSRYSRQTLNQLLIELDGFEEDQGVIVVAATNFPEVLDKALIRPGRFDSRVTVTLPDIKGRTNILKLYMDKSHCSDDVDVDVIARSTPGFSGAELSNLVNQAALRAASLQLSAITMEHFEWARDKIVMGPERRSAVVEKNDQILTAYHEGGHAIVALFTEDADSPQKATIVPRGQALGYVMTLPTKDELSVSQKQLLAKMDVAMGGRVAEELIFGDDSITTGASSDFQQATRIARAMVTQYGFSDKVGIVLVDEQQNRISPELNRVIETEVRRLIQESYARAKAVLLKHKKEHKLLAEGLLKYETLTADEIKRVIRGEVLKT